MTEQHPAMLAARNSWRCVQGHLKDEWLSLMANDIVIEDPDDKLHALRVISEYTMPGRWDEVRDSQKNEIKMTGVIAMDIESASAKISAGMPDDEDEDYEIPIWAGILPLRTAFTSLQSDDRLIDGVEPSDVLRAMEGKVL